MAARAEYERKLKELGSEEEDDLEVIDEAEASPDEDAMEEDGVPPPRDKGKSRMVESGGPERGEQLDSRRKRPRIDPFSGNLYLGPSHSVAKLIHSQDTVKITLITRSQRNPRNRRRRSPHPLYLWQVATQLPKHQISQDGVLLHQQLTRSSSGKPDGRRRS